MNVKVTKIGMSYTYELNSRQTHHLVKIEGRHKYATERSAINAAKRVYTKLMISGALK